MNIPDYEQDICRDTLKIVKQYDIPLKTVIDIGAHVGYFSIPTALHADIVYAIEPAMDNYWNLVNNIFDDNLTKKIFPIHVAIWNDKDEVEIGHVPNGNSGQYIVFPGNRDNKSTVKAITFPKLIDMVGNVDYLKIDIEAGEFNIFPPIDEIKRALSNVNILELSIHAQWQAEFFDKQGAIEFSAYKDLENSEHDLIQFLAGCGFKLKRDDGNGLIYHGFNSNFKKENK